ncbi:hypothetical protein [Nostoc sp. UHCC 0302]|uniref:hypothetical protein n=1 Tax=Nostoc sp. UHCC 0302 TaxID=3134896 RepID=UPI00311C9214
MNSLALEFSDKSNDCNTFLGEDAMNRVSTNGLFVTFFFQIGISYSWRSLSLWEKVYTASPYRYLGALGLVALHLSAVSVILPLSRDLPA